MTWLDEINDQLRVVIERCAERPLAELGFLLSELRENHGEHLERANRELVSSTLLQSLSSNEVSTLLAVAIGADAARVAEQAGALGDAVLEGADRDEVACIAAESIGFDEFLEERMSAAQKALEKAGVQVSIAGSDEEQLRITYLAKRSYEHFVADSVEEELAAQSH